eukprot:CAMPEP_0172739604 /NCGR_PEP_ID=MMETSP1074-20121228/122930_1 /TAXON_ID=2916 /ORGANISM="Ceratium fusus, Strain PA161109" /LENGTH=61 /DNA_ID=CAMNT_0013569517 /DNA_START=53 /DNA_END=235 /DNA_ORIENTATION=-
MGDGTDASSCGAWSGALADCVLFPILTMFNYSLQDVVMTPPSDQIVITARTQAKSHGGQGS